MPTDRAVEFQSDDADRTVRLTYQPDDVNPGFGAFAVEIRADGLACNETVATISGDGLDGFLTQLAEDWAGWQGSRLWASLEQGMSVEATHRGDRVMLLFTVRGVADPDTWEVRLPISIEPGESLSRLAAATSRLLAVG